LIDEADTFVRENDELRGSIPVTQRPRSSFELSVTITIHGPFQPGARRRSLDRQVAGTLADRVEISGDGRPVSGSSRLRQDQIEPGCAVLRRRRHGGRRIIFTICMRLIGRACRAA
jgi:hypothetical protein